MSLAYFARNAASGERKRARLLRAGVTPQGHKIWTESELDVLRRLGGDYNTICEILPHRTRHAIRFKSVRLGLEGAGISPHHWTAAELSRLRKLYPATPPVEICAAFPHSSWVNIQQVARYHNLRRLKKPYKITGIPALDAVRVRCYEIGWTMRDLDSAARTGSYFKRCGWIGKKVNHRALGRAIEALDGVVQAQWRA